MARTAVPYVVFGQVYTASNYNQFVADNEAAHWPYTAAGDQAFATSSSALDRLPIGTPGQIQTVNDAGTAPEWRANNAAAMALVLGG